MGSNLAKAPLTGIIFAALLTFVAALFPLTPDYALAQQEFVMPLWGYGLLVVRGIWISLLLGLLFYHSRAKGILFLLQTFGIFLGFSCIIPLLEQLIRGEPSGVMATRDTLFQIVIFAICLLLLIVLCNMLFRRQEVDKSLQATYKIRKLPMLIRVVASPFVFLIFYFPFWYFFAWRKGVVRAYYTAAEAEPDKGFIAEMIDMLLEDAKMVPFALLLGLVLVLLSILVLTQIPAKRIMFIGVNIALYLSSALFWLIPSPVYPSALRSAQFIRYAVLMVVYGALTGIMLHTALLREDPPRAAAPPEMPPGKPAPTKPKRR